MDYQKVYDSIISRAKKRKVTGYKERHHIVPKCLEGSNKKDNLVDLTAREHFICHWLLSRMYPSNRKIAYAFFAMCRQKNLNQSERYTPSSRTYEEARSNYSKLGFSQEHIGKIVATRKGKKTVYNLETGEQLYIDKSKLQYYLEKGWVNSHKSKGVKRSNKTKATIAENARKRFTGRTGEQAQASKGWVICEYEDGTKIEAGSGLQLSKLIKISCGTVSNRVNKEPEFIKGFKIYYKYSKG